jgi:acetylglutamate kinase
MTTSSPPPNPELTPHAHAAILSEALPYMQRYDQQVVVVKYGGHAMGKPELSECFAKDIVLLEQSSVKPIVVHGGGPQIGKLLQRLNIQSEFADGLRITDAATMEVVEMVLAGAINKQIVAEINRFGGRACGISGKDAHLMTARKLVRRVRDAVTGEERIVDLGFVGEPEIVNPQLLEVITDGDFIPVVAPLGASREGVTYNINGDTFACSLAAAMKAKRLLLLTDVPGVLDKNGQLIAKLTVSEARALIADGTITGGMIPKVLGCIEVVEAGVEGVVIINGKVPHAVLIELFTKHGAGTLIKQD